LEPKNKLLISKKEIEEEQRMRNFSSENGQRLNAERKVAQT